MGKETSQMIFKRRGNCISMFSVTDCIGDRMRLIISMRLWTKLEQNYTDVTPCCGISRAVTSIGSCIGPYRLCV
jgi:hypothetical protein